VRLLAGQQAARSDLGGKSCGLVAVMNACESCWSVSVEECTTAGI
jgi:hypothetical protein